MNGILDVTTQKVKKIMISHPDPFGTGVGIKMIWHPLMDGPIDKYKVNGWTAEEIEIDPKNRYKIKKFKAK